VEKDLEEGISTETLDIGVIIISGSIGDIIVDPDYWVYVQNDDETVITEDESIVNADDKIIIKQGASDDVGSKLAAIIIIAAALVVTITLLAAAYIILKNKFASRQETNVQHAINISESADSKSQGDDELEKQYVPNLVFGEDEKKLGQAKKKAN